MAVIGTAHETADDRTAENNLGIRTYTRSFLVKTDSRSDGPYTAGSASGLPLIGSTHPEDPSAWCRRLSVRQESPNAPQAWRITAFYDSTIELNENPNFEPARVSWTGEKYQEVALSDNAGQAVLNSAGDYFSDPPVMRDQTRPIVTVTKNLPTSPTWILTYQDAVNSAAFTVGGVLIAAGKAKLDVVSVSERQSRNGYDFYTVTMPIHLRREGWTAQPLDAGYRYKSSSSRFIATSDDGTAPTQPIPLNGSGAILANPGVANAVFLSFDIYDTADFNALPLT